MSMKIVMICSVLWILGLLSGYTMAGHIHILLLMAVIIMLVKEIHELRYL